jgi:micrococcal nuclease
VGSQSPARLIAAFTLAVATLTVIGCSGRAAAGAPRGVSGRIVAVADGDTISVRIDSAVVRRVRLLSIDSPEKFDTRFGIPRECGSLAASAFMERFDGRRVTLIADPSQDSVDGYGRLLRYVQLPGGGDLGGAEVDRGLAMPYVFDAPAHRHRHYLVLAEAARRERRGTWGPPCGGDFHSSVPGIQNGIA